MNRGIHRFYRYTLLLMLIGSLTVAQAQVHLAPTVSLNINNISFDPEPDEDFGDVKSKTGFGFGVIVSFMLSEIIAVQLEPMFMQRGTSLEQSGSFGGDTFSAKQSINLTFIDIPVLFRASFGSSGSVQPFVAAGPDIGFLLSAKTKVDEATINGQPVPDIDGEEEDIKDETKSVDFGVNLGGGVAIPAGNGSLILEAFYNLGLANLLDSSDDSDDGSAKNRGILVKAGFAFPIGGN